MSHDCDCNLVWMSFLNFLQNYVSSISMVCLHLSQAPEAFFVQHERHLQRRSIETRLADLAASKKSHAKVGKSLCFSHELSFLFLEGCLISTFWYGMFEERATHYLSNKSMTSPYLSSCLEWRTPGVSCCVVEKYFWTYCVYLYVDIYIYICV